VNEAQPPPCLRIESLARAFGHHSAAGPALMTSLYRRHRPQSFGEVVGQAHIVRTMSNAVEQGKVHHAYLFVGSRGTGKTSVAKILARSLNCVKGPTLTPCGECEACRTIANSTSLDVIEMDAASNNSVEDIRELREKVSFAPALGRWKVYILDEAHMLSTSAWNAFLKTLEEPPPSTIFVLATTEAHKVPATIVDRCHRFDFQRPSLEEITIVLKRIAEAEGIEADDKALAMIARAAGGSFRDAIGTLDQLVTYGGKKVALQDVLDVLDVADADLIFNATDALIAHDAGQALARVDELAESGRDPTQFMRDLTAHLRHLVVVQTIGEAPDSFSVTADETERLEAQAQQMSQTEVVRAIDLVSAALAAVKEGSDARIQLELALLKAARPRADTSIEAMLARIEELERSAGVGGTSSPEPAPGSAAGTPPQEKEPARRKAAGVGRKSDGRSTRGRSTEAAGATVLREAPESARSAQKADPGEPQSRSSPQAATSGVSPSGATATAAAPTGTRDPNTLWSAALERVAAMEGGGMLAALLQEARPVSLGESALVLSYPPSAAFSKRKAEDAANAERVAEALRMVSGEPLVPRFELSDAPVDPARLDQPESVLSEEEVIERIKEVFGAEDVPEEHGGATGSTQ
jgi:DNA polymerase-3 subunit gamma/tau